MSVVQNTDVEHVEQTGKFRQIKAKFNAWKKEWDQGSKWGIVGGSPLKNLPDTVLDQALEHGESSYARDRARTIEGLGELLTAITEILDGDAILVEDREELKDAIKQMETVLKNKKWNPRNIPFHTVTRFVETDDPKKPNITRGKVHGHYRTEAYNEYVAWALEHKENFKGQLADTDASWYNKKQGQARPPLWLAITGEEDGGILAIAREAAKAVDKIKIGDNTKYRIYSSSKGPEVLATIPSVQAKVREVLAMPDIYPRGKARAPVKDRLNAAFSNQVYAIANEEDARKFGQFIRGWDRYVGLEKIKQVRLSFPANNLALNKLIKLVLGEEINTFQKPGTSPEDVKPGLTLKAKEVKTWSDILKGV